MEPGIEVKKVKGKNELVSLKSFISKMPFGEGNDKNPYPNKSLIKKNKSDMTEKCVHLKSDFWISFLSVLSDLE